MFTNNNKAASKKKNPQTILLAQENFSFYKKSAKVNVTTI